MRQHLKTSLNWIKPHSPARAAVRNGRQELADYAETFFTEQPLYLIYQYGKAGSSSILATLSSLRLPAVHCHHLSERNLVFRERLASHHSVRAKSRGKIFFTNARYRLFRNLLEQRTAAVKIVTTVRAPDTYLKSAYFQQRKYFEGFIQHRFGVYNPDTMIRYFEEGLAESPDWISDLAKGEGNYLRRLISSEDAGIAHLALMVFNYVTWFDEELFKTFNLDPAAILEHDRFWSFEGANVDGVIIRLEDFDAGAIDAVTHICGSPVKNLKEKNVGEQKLHGDYYGKFKSDATIPESTLNIMLKTWPVEMFYRTQSTSGPQVSARTNPSG